jgi:hypothetical protein
LIEPLNMSKETQLIEVVDGRSASEFGDHRWILNVLSKSLCESLQSPARIVLDQFGMD